MTDKQLVRFAADFREGVLDGASSSQRCFIVCWPLSGLLALHEVTCTLEELCFYVGPATSNHVVLRLEDGRILDPTADQYGLEPVYLGPMPVQYLAWMELSD